MKQSFPCLLLSYQMANRENRFEHQNVGRRVTRKAALSSTTCSTLGVRRRRSRDRIGPVWIVPDRQSLDLVKTTGPEVNMDWVYPITCNTG